MALKINYKDDGFTGNRKYRPITNADNTQSFEDVTPYNPVGDSFGAKDINDTNKAVNAVTTPVFEDYTSTAVPDPDTALNAIKSNTALTTVLSNIKGVLKGTFFRKHILTTMEQVMANTLAARVPDARVVKELNSNLGGNKLIAEGSGANTKYYIQLGADAASKKLLGSTDNYLFRNDILPYTITAITGEKVSGNQSVGYSSAGFQMQFTNCSWWYSYGTLTAISKNLFENNDFTTIDFSITNNTEIDKYVISILDESKNVIASVTVTGSNKTVITTLLNLPSKFYIKLWMNMFNCGGTNYNSGRNAFIRVNSIKIY